MKSCAKTFAFWAATLLLWELILHVVVFGGISGRFLYAVLFSCSAAALFAFFSCLIPRGNRVVQFVLLGLLFLIYAVQLVYHQVFGTLLSLSFLSMGGDAIGTFTHTVMQAILASIPGLILLALPFVALALLHKKEWLPRTRWTFRQQATLIGGAVACFACAVLLLQIPVGSGLSPYQIYSDLSASVDRQTEYFGLLTAERLELGRLDSDSVQLSAGAVDLTAGSADTTERNVMAGMDFDKLDTMTDDENLLALNDYFSSLSGTSKNEYTGMFKDYNLIVVCAEAFSPYLIDEELTPTLYKLSHEGFVFENFYNSFPSLTTNGEYGLCMGLMPDLSRRSFAASMENYLPFCLGNRFQTVGIQPRAYHNNVGTFYNRINTHSNMGYQFSAIGCGLDMERTSPGSDLIMMQKTVDDYINETPFVSYYMSYSGHADYDFTTNAMSIKNKARVQNLDCSEALRAYYACQLELEDAMTYLLDRLEQAGIADRTVIVLTGDHYPFGLPEESYAELAGDATSEPFWKYRNSFICWNGGMETPVTVSDYCCTQDILPTLLNLFGLEYDSRLLTGTDVFSDSTHVALLQDGSFLTKALLYDSSTGQITWQQPEENYESGYAQELIEATNNLFSVSSAILRTDYYGFAFPSLGLGERQENTHIYVSYADTAGTWYEQAVEQLIPAGALTGTDCDSFAGGDPATRAAFVTMLSRMLYLEAPEDVTVPFTDVPAGQWYSTPIAAAWNAGLLSSSTTTRPNDAITPYEAQLLLQRAANLLGMENAEEWAENAVQTTVAEAQKNGESTTTLTRGAAAYMLSMLVDHIE